MRGRSKMNTEYNVTGTCGECGGAIIMPIFWSGNYPPAEWCINCGRYVEQPIIPAFGEIRKMKSKI